MIASSFRFSALSALGNLLSAAAFAGALGKFLHDIRKRSAYASRADKGMFDLGDIAALVDPPRTCQWEAAQAPSVRSDYRYDFKQTNGPLLRITTIDRDASFALLDQALARIAKPSPPSKP